MAQRQTTAEGSRKSLVNLRISARDRDLIDRAAAALGKNRSEFMLDATRQAAEDTLLDRRARPCPETTVRSGSTSPAASPNSPPPPPPPPPLILVARLKDVEAALALPGALGFAHQGVVETGKPLAERRCPGRKLRPPARKPLNVTLQAGDDLALQVPVIAPGGLLQSLVERWRQALDRDGRHCDGIHFGTEMRVSDAGVSESIRPVLPWPRLGSSATAPLTQGEGVAPAFVIPAKARPRGSGGNDGLIPWGPPALGPLAPGPPAPGNPLRRIGIG